MARSGSNEDVGSVGEGNKFPNCNDQRATKALVDGCEQGEWHNVDGHIECENIDYEKDYEDASSHDIEHIDYGKDYEDDEDGYGSEDEDDDDECTEGDGSSDDVEEEDDGLGLEVGNIEEVRRSSVFYGPDQKPFFMLGQTYRCKQDVIKAIDNCAIMNNVNIKLIKNDKKRVSAKCEEGCPFYIYASMDGREPGLKVKSLHEEHECLRIYKNSRATARWVARYFRNKVQERPNYKVKDMKKDLEDELKLAVSVHKCKRAKKIIVEELKGSYKDEFSCLEAYCNELRHSNPGSDVFLEISREALEQGRRVFSKMYLCFNSSKVGWRQGCRPLIGVDGTFLKGNAKGILLTATALDADDSLFPIAFALTQQENRHSWTWFLQSLQRSLDLGDGSSVTLMSDMQKGLQFAVGDVLPLAEHRFSARHIYANWSRQWRGSELKKRFFVCAWSTFEVQFKDNLKALGTLSKKAAERLLIYPPQTWVRAYFSSRCKSWIVDNNLSESLNAWIDEYRYFPVIRMFEGIRLKMMTKWADSDMKVARWHGQFSPKCMEVFETNRFLSVGCRVHFNGDKGYEVTEGEDRHTVLLSSHICTCRVWDLTGIPCQHAICALYHAKIDPMTLISSYYHKSSYLQSYAHKLQPVRGRSFWETDLFEVMEPPPIMKLSGRPKKKRVRTEESSRRRKTWPASTRLEVSSQGTQKLPRVNQQQRCKVCNESGHNKSTCKKAPPNTSKRVETRGRKKQSESLVAGGQEAQPSVTQESLTIVAQQSQPLVTQESQTIVSQEPQPPSRTTCKSGYKRMAQFGYGVFIDEVTGTTILDPGMPHEFMIDPGNTSEILDHLPDTENRFPVPNEREIQRHSRPSNSTKGGARVITFNTDGTNVSRPSNLPFKPPGLMWNGQPSCTTSHLEADNIRLRTQLKKKASESRNMSLR